MILRKSMASRPISAAAHILAPGKSLALDEVRKKFVAPHTL